MNLPDDDEIEKYISNLSWSDNTDDINKTLVAGNIRGFFSWLKKKSIQKLVEEAKEAIEDAGISSVDMTAKRYVRKFEKMGYEDEAEEIYQFYLNLWS